MQNTAKVLLADANEEFRALLAGAIGKTGEFTVVGSTGDGLEALRLAEEQTPDLLILDTVLPGLDGFGILRRLPELGAPKAIVLSGYFSDRAAAEALELGAAYYLTKPCQMDALLERMLKGMADMPWLTVYGDPTAAKRFGVVSFNVQDVHPHDVATILDAGGVAIRAGHHCAQPLMDFLGIGSCCRASVAIYNTPEDIDALLNNLENVRKVMGL